MWIRVKLYASRALRFLTTWFCPQWLPAAFIFIFIAAIMGFYVDIVLHSPGRLKRLQVFVLGGFIGLASLVFFCFFRVMFTDPGPIPNTFPQVKKRVVKCYQSKRNGCRRYCRQCKTYKPDRAHHCFTCKRCVAKMDHHCIFVNNCVGFNNYKYFLQFLFYSSLTGFYSAATLFMGHSQHGKVRSLFRGSQRITIGMTWIMCTAVAIVIGMFWLLHIVMIMKNYTTIEFSEKKHERRNGRVFENIFHIGWKKNFGDLFGWNPFLWFIPSRDGVRGTGIEFPVNEKAEF